MAKSTPIDTEDILLGELLTFPDAAQVVMPILSNDRFLYGESGNLGDSQHKELYRAMTLAWMQHKNISIPNVMEHLHGQDDLRTYMISLQDQLRHKYKVRDFDRFAVEDRARQISKQGLVYSIGRKVAKVAKITSDEKEFINFVTNLDNVDLWAANFLNELRIDTQTANSAGYEDTDKGVEEAIEEFDRIVSGESTALLPTGIPALTGAALIPLARLIIVHGLSNGGKSVLTHLANLGTAIGLKQSGVKGCVAINALEESKIDIYYVMASMLSGFDISQLLTNPTEISEEDVGRFKEWLRFVQTLPIEIDETKGIASGTMAFRAQGLHISDRGPIWALTSDYIEMFGDDGDNKEQRLDHIARVHHQLSRDLGAAVMLVSQSTFNNTKYMIAGPDGLRYSKGIRQKADVIVEVWNPVEMDKAGVTYAVPDSMDSNHLWLLVQKYKRGPKSRPIPMRWEPKYTQIFDPTIDNGMGQDLLFEHLKDMEEFMGNKTSEVIAIKDSAVGDLFEFESF